MNTDKAAPEGQGALPAETPAPAPTPAFGAGAGAGGGGGGGPSHQTMWVTGPAWAGGGGGGTSKVVLKTMRERYMKDFGMRAKLARGAIEVNDAAAAIGVHRNTIWNIERGDTLPDAFELALMADLYGVTVENLVRAEAMPRASHTMEKSVRAVEIGDMVYVPHFDLQVSAGPGAFQNVESVIAMRGFDRAYIRGDLGIAHNELAMCFVSGRSALPELKPRDTILVDLRDRSVANEGLHVVRLDDTLILKKLQRLPGRVLRVSSSNPEYGPFEINGFEDSQRDFEVIGRVRWGGITYP